jgi:hypothetical protein
MAQNTKAPPGRDILVAGQGAVADARSPAAVTVNVGDKAIAPRARLELSLAPVTAADEGYLIEVSVKPPDGPLRRLGSVSFFPPRAGVAQVFYFDAAPIAAVAANRGGQAELSIALAPAEPTQKVTSSVRVVGARLVGG